MELNNLKGLNYIDFEVPNQQFANNIAKKDVCTRIKKVIRDENQAIMEYKGLVAHHFNILSPSSRKEIIEISNDETDHRAKFEVILKELKCD